jgi:hypothetical protein
MSFVNFGHYGLAYFYPNLVCVTKFHMPMTRYYVQGNCHVYKLFNETFAMIRIKPLNHLKDNMN